MGVRVLKGGMLTTVQDLGRTGYQSQGFGVSGVMDVRSFKIANLLLDNPENEAVLEFTLMGPTLEFTSETIIAITGGDFQPQVNGKPIKNYTAVYIHRGDILSFRGARTGSRGYIAFSSYLEIPVVMGSRSTNIKCGLGGFKGRRLLDGDYISFRAKRRYLPYFLSRSLDLNEFDQDNITLRVIMGPQDDAFTAAGKETFLSSEYVVTSEFDRMGCFAYSEEEGTAAAEFEDQIDEEVRAHRADILMEQQAEVSAAKNAAKIGKRMTAVIEGYDKYAGCYFGRTAADAPDIDGKIFIKSDSRLRLGQYITVEVFDTMDYDLLAEEVTDESAE